MLIKTLLSGAELLLLDEPFASMDKESQKKGVEIIMKTEKTVLFTTHNDSIVPDGVRKIIL